MEQAKCGQNARKMCSLQQIYKWRNIMFVKNRDEKVGTI